MHFQQLDIIERNSDPFIQQILFVSLIVCLLSTFATVINLTRKVPVVKELTF